MASRVDASAQIIPIYKSEDGSSRYRCIKCQKPLDLMTLGSVEIDVCPDKHGIWFDAAELQTVLHEAAHGVHGGLGAKSTAPESWQPSNDDIDILKARVGPTISDLFDLL